MDLADVVGNSGSFYKSPNTPEEWGKYKFTSDQIQTFHRDGYLVLDSPTFTEEQCDVLLQNYNQIIKLKNSSPEMALMYEHHANQGGDPDDVLFHSLGHWRVAGGFHDLIYHPALTAGAAQLLSDNQHHLTKLRFWHDQLFGKPPYHVGRGRLAPGLQLLDKNKTNKAYNALDEQNLENGCIHYIPGSHKWTRDGAPLPITDYNFKDMPSIKTILTQEEKRNFTPRPCELKRGQVVFHHAIVVHGSYNNRSSKPRRAAVVNYLADGVKSDTDERLMEGVDVVPKGQKIAGKFFPTVFDKEKL